MHNVSNSSSPGPCSDPSGDGGPESPSSQNPGLELDIPIGECGGHAGSSEGGNTQDDPPGGNSTCNA